MVKFSNVVCALFGIAGVCSSAHADFSTVTDRNRDGFINVLDIAAERGLGGLVSADRAVIPTLVFDAAETFGVPGGEVRVLVLIEDLGVPLFGYSLDVDVAPVMGATGALVPSLSETNFFDARNLITAGGAMRDGFFSVIQLSADDGIFVSTNTDDASAVTASAGVNDVLVELVFDASNDARGTFEISFGPGSALANAGGKAVPFENIPAMVSILEPVVSGPTYYEMGDGPASTNNFFDDREVFSVADRFCSYISGKLQEDRDPGRYPDTYLFMFDKDDNILCEDNDSSNKGNGKASACFDVAPVPDGDGGSATVRLGITGRADGVDPLFNGLFFNAPHGQLGEAEACVTYYGAGGEVIGTDTYLCTFVTGAEAFRVNFVVPDGTASVDVELDNTTETFPICADVDYYEINGLESSCDYVITVVGGTLHEDGGRCEILAWADKHGTLLYPIGVPHERNGGDTGQGAQLSVIADVNGRIRLAVSGVGDEDFDGWLDAVDGVEGRSIETPGYEPPPAHGCCSCYTLKIEWAKHLAPGGEIPSGEGVGLLLANGDLNVDGAVNVIDLAMMLNNWGWTAP